jgi:hypothetical protein
MSAVKYSPTDGQTRTIRGYSIGPAGIVFPDPQAFLDEHPYFARTEAVSDLDMAHAAPSRQPESYSAASDDLAMELESIRRDMTDANYEELAKLSDRIHELDTKIECRIDDELAYVEGRLACGIRGIESDTDISGLTPGNWTGGIPTSVKDALERIAAASGPIA